MHNHAEPMTANAVAPAKPKIGRPSIYTQELADEICQRLSEGESIRSITRDVHMPDRATVAYWAVHNETFSRQYARAREDLADHYFDETLAIADSATPEGERVARLKVDTRKWVVARMAPWKYGDRQIVEQISHETPEQQDDRQLARAVLLALGANLQSLVKPELSARETANLIQGEMSKVLDVEPEDV